MKINSDSEIASYQHMEIMQRISYRVLEKNPAADLIVLLLEVGTITQFKFTYNGIETLSNSKLNNVTHTDQEKGMSHETVEHSDFTTCNFSTGLNYSNMSCYKAEF